MKSSLNSIEKVITKITSIQAITEDGTAEADSISAMDFALLIAKFTSSLSSGVITEEIITLSQKIIQAKVTAAPSKAILILLKSAASSAGSLQMTILSEIVMIKQTLMQVLVTNKISITTIKFTIQDFDSEGKLITVVESGGKTDSTEEELKTSMTAFKTSQTTLMKVETLLKATKDFDFTSMTTVPTTEVTMVEFMTKLTSFIMMVGKDMSSSKVETIGTELMLMKMKSKGSATMISKLTFIISTVTTYVVQITTEITSVQKQITYPTTTTVTFEEAQKQITALTKVTESFNSVSTAITSSMASTDKTATNSASSFFSDSNTFFITISTITIETLKTGSNTAITTLSQKLVTASEAGVSPSSGKYKLIFQTIIQSITIFVTIIQVQIDLLKTVSSVTEAPVTGTVPQVTENAGCQALLENFRLLKENEIAVGQTIAIIEMISNNTDFSTFSPSMCDTYLGSGYGDGFGSGSGSGMGSGPPGPERRPCGSDTPKPTSTILSIIKGLKTGLSSSINETSTFSTADTIVGSIFQFKFDTFSPADLATLSTDSAELSTFLDSIKKEQVVVNTKIEKLKCDVSEVDYKTISIPPCKPEPMPLKEELLMKLTGLFANLEATESTIEAVKAVIKGGLTKTTVTVDNFIVIYESLSAVFDLYKPCELFKVVIQEIASLLVFFSTTSENPTAEQIIQLQGFLNILLQFKLDIIVQINIIQSQLSELTGSTVDPSSLIIFTIGPDGQIGTADDMATPSPGPLLPRDEEALIEVVISNLQSAITYIELIIIKIISIIDKTFIIDASAEYTCSDYLGIVIEFLTLLVRGQIGPELEAAANKVLAVSSISSACGAGTISYFEIVLLALRQINVNVIGALTIIIQKLIISRGLIVTINIEELSMKPFNEQESQLEKSLKELRESCLGMDRVAGELDVFLTSVTCGTEADASKEIGSLIAKLTALSKMSAFSIEDAGIEGLASEILGLISQSASTKLSGKQCKTIESFIIIIQNTVLTYVSQISILEQIKLQISGELKFSFSSFPPITNEEDFAKLEEKDKAQLEGLMRCGDFTERSTESIKLSFDVVEPDFNNKCNGREVLKKAQRITAMCSSEVLPVEEVADNTKDLARCSNSLDRPLNEREISTLEFILISLNTFAVTFSSQITIVQQRLTFLTGQTVTAADLFLQFIGPDGNLYPALPLDIGNGDPALVPANMLEIPDEPHFKVGRELFLVKQWTEFRFAFSTMQIVIKSITSVLDIEGALAPSAYFKSGPEFLIEVSSYFIMIGQGLFTSDYLYDATFNIIKCASQVSMEVSNRIILLLESITIGIKGFQMACGSEFIIIQQKLIQIVTIPVSSLQIEGTEFNREGEVIVYSMGTGTTPGDLLEIDDRIWILRDTLLKLQTVMRCIDAGIEFDFVGLQTIEAVEPNIFLTELNQIILSLSIDMTYIDLEAFDRFITWSLLFPPSGRQLESLKSIKSTVFSYCSMLAAEVSQAQSTKQDISNNTITETDITALQKKSQDVQQQIATYDSLLSSISIRIDTCGINNPMSAFVFFNEVFDFYILMVSEDNIANEQLDNFATAITPSGSNRIRCITGSFEIVFVIVRIAITIYIEISTLILALVNEAILEISGQCPTGYELGDWNTGEGECCCDPNNQPEEETYDLEEPFLIPPTYEEPVLIDGEEPFLINGEEPVLIPGEEPVPIPLMEEPVPLFLMEEPVPINGNYSGYGEEPIPIPMWEEPVLIGGEEPVLIGGEEPVLIGGEEPVPITFAFEEPVLIPEREPITGPAPELPTVPPYKPAPPKPEKKFCYCRKNTSATPGPSVTPVPSPPGQSPAPGTPPSPSPTPGIPPSPTPGTPVSPTPIPGISPAPGTAPPPGISPAPGTAPPPGISPAPGTAPPPGISLPPVTAPPPGISLPPGTAPPPGISPGPGTAPPPGISPAPGTAPPPGVSPGPGTPPPPGISPAPGTAPPPGFTPSILTPSGATGQVPHKLTKTTPGPMGSIPFKIPKSTTPSTEVKGQMPYKLPKSTTPKSLLKRIANAANIVL